MLLSPLPRASHCPVARLRIAMRFAATRSMLVKSPATTSRVSSGPSPSGSQRVEARTGPFAPDGVMDNGPGSDVTAVRVATIPIESVRIRGQAARSQETHEPSVHVVDTEFNVGGHGQAKRFCDRSRAESRVAPDHLVTIAFWLA